MTVSFVEDTLSQQVAKPPLKGKLTSHAENTLHTRYLETRAGLQQQCELGAQGSSSENVICLSVINANNTVLHAQNPFNSDEESDD